MQVPEGSQGGDTAEVLSSALVLGERNQPSIFDRNLDPEDEEYVLMSLTREECTPDSRAAYEPVAICGWGRLPGRSVTAPEFGMEETVLTWITWARDNNRRLHAAVL